MLRFITAFSLLLLGMPSIVLAAKDTSSPPISGDMVKLTPYETPQTMSRVYIASADKGLTNLIEFKGKIVVLNIWAKWCPPCIAELPSLNALQLALGGEYLQVVTVSIDEGSLEDVKKYLTDNNLNALPAYADSNKDVQKLDILRGVAGVPVTLIIDPQTRILARVEGDADWNGKAAREVLEYYMKNVSYSLFK